MNAWLVMLLLAVLAGTWIGVGLLRRLSLSRGIIDVPNERSSHRQPMPRGGGLAIVVVVSLAVAVLAWRGYMPVDLSLALLVPGVLIAGVGYADDLVGASARVRILIHAIAATAAIAWLGGWQSDGMEPGSAAWIALQVATVVGVVWAVNLYNFMDGIDGIAGAEAAFLGFGAAWLLSSEYETAGVARASLVIGAASAGFQFWNWPPARIFMGDVGSGYLGFVFAVLAVATARLEPPLLWAWLILGGAFLVDSGVTLLRRLVRRERIYLAHRSHAYQWLARRFGGHAPVTLMYTAVNVFWLLPMAWLCLQHPDSAPWITLIAYAPITAAALACGAGRPEVRPAR